ncbi:hypothetical protein E2562_011148 [Oryza meyeriana var. granulata]|uniref:RING-type E3 ubiquitin transferase n=2 Tax=Oryza meyeriana var. granulata TaxID=110450 RepID=A0A6G1DH29_9ORYZ|nr:hypothetical protein E2562_011148 [Oryza meyeriana var. granulata]
MDEEEIHIAVGKNTKKEKANILWAAARFPRATIVLVHVHWPSKWMPFMGGKVLYKFADEKEKEMHRTKETDAMVKMLSRYKNHCGTRKVRAHYLSHDDVLAGVVNLIKKLKIKRIVIGSRSMSKEAMLRKCCQVCVVINGKHMSTSNDHLEHTGSIGYGGSPESLASIHELSDDSNGYTTPPSDFADEIIYDDGVIQMDGTDELATEAETEDEEITETGEPNSCKEVEHFSEEIAHQTDEIQSFRSITERAEELMEEIDKLQRKLKELQEEDHEKSILSPRQKAAASLKEKGLSTPRYGYPELQLPEHISRFSMSKISKATDNFYSRNLIGEGGYGPVYKGKLGGVPVAIKLLRPHGKQGFPEYKQEVVVLSRIEHPHIVKLIGVCPESCILVYEHLPNGTLLDRLSKGLPWKDRVRILAEQRQCQPAGGLRDGAHGAHEATGGGDYLPPDQPHGNHGIHGPRLLHDRRAHHGVRRVRFRGGHPAGAHRPARPQHRRPGAGGGQDGRRALCAGRIRRELAGGADRAAAPAGTEVLQPGEEAATSDHMRR